MVIEVPPVVAGPLAGESDEMIGGSYTWNASAAGALYCCPLSATRSGYMRGVTRRMVAGEMHTRLDALSPPTPAREAGTVASPKAQRTSVRAPWLPHSPKPWMVTRAPPSLGPLLGLTDEMAIGLWNVKGRASAVNCCALSEYSKLGCG